MMNISSIEIVDKLLYDTGKYWWTGSLDELKQFVDKNLEIMGKWSSPGGNIKLFAATDSRYYRISLLNGTALARRSLQ